MRFRQHVAFKDIYGKPVRIVAPFAPGGGTNVSTRYLVTYLSESLKRQFLVDKRAGATQ